MYNAYIGEILSLNKIENADRIEAAEVQCGDGGTWGVVVKKGDFSVGDLCEAYLQDSLLPEDDPRFNFMQNYKYRVRMARLKGAPSEALVMKVSDEARGLGVGSPIDEIIGVKKYEKELPAKLAGDIYGLFPIELIPKTNQPNFQTSKHLVEALRGNPYYITQKIDGTSGTAYKHGSHLGVCSRNYELKEDGKNIYWRAARECGIVDFLEKCNGPKNLAVQFEVAGPGINKNPLKLKGTQVFVFDIYNIDLQKYLGYNDLTSTLWTFGLSMVPVLIKGESFNYSPDHLRSLAGKNKYAEDREQEGIVIRSMSEMMVNFQRVSFKVLNLNYKD